MPNESKDENENLNEYENDANHVSPLSKGLHNQTFAVWLAHTYGLSRLRSKAGVFDIAGGQGLISFHLAVRFGINCTMIERNLVKLKTIHRRLLLKLHKNRSKLFGAQSHELIPLSDIDPSPLMKMLHQNYPVFDDGVLSPHLQHSLDLMKEGGNEVENLAPYNYIRRIFRYPEPKPEEPQPASATDTIEEIPIRDILSDASVLVGMHAVMHFIYCVFQYC